MDIALFLAVFHSQKCLKNNAQKRGFRFFIKIILLPILVASFMLGMLFINHIQQIQPDDFGKALAVFIVAYGFISGIWDGAYILRFSSLRPFQVSNLDLFLVEMLAALTTTFMQFLWLATGAFCLGVIVVSPLRGMITVPLLVFMMFASVCADHVFGVFGRLFGRHFKLIVIITVPFFLLRLFNTFRHGQPFFIFGSPFPDGAVKWLPTTQMITAILENDWVAMVLPTIWMVAISLCTYVLMWGDLSGNSKLIGTGEGHRRPWTFNRVWVGVAKHQWQQIWNSKHGRFFFFIPLLALEGILLPQLAGFKPGSTYYVGLMGFMTFPVGGLAYNLFGMDRGGVRGFWPLPLTDKDLLMGKAAGTFAYLLVFASFHVLCLSMVVPLTKEWGLVALLFCISQFVANVSFGLRFSVAHPKYVDPTGMAPSDVDGAVFKKIGIILFPWLILTILLWILSQFGVFPLVLGLFGNLVVFGVFFIINLSKASYDLKLHRDSLSSVIEAN